MKISTNGHSIVTTTLFALVLSASAATASTITLGGYTFDTTAFPTSAAYVSGGPASFSFSSSGTTDSKLVKATDSDLTSYMYGTPVDFTVTFGNAALKNLSGADFVIFELGSKDDITVKVNGVTKTYLVSDTGFNVNGRDLNAIAIDLSSFGIANNALVSTIEVNNASGRRDSAEIAAIGALHTASAVPEPATLGSFAGGLALLALFRRKLTGSRS